MAAELIERQTALSSHIIQFCRFLRSKKYECGIQEEQEVLKALSQYIPPSNLEFLLVFQTILVKNKEQRFRFEDLFNYYWKQLERGEDSKVKNKDNKSMQKLPQRAPTISELKSWLYNGPTSEEEEVSAYSPVEIFAKKDFSAFDKQDIDDLIPIVKRLARSLALRDSRRYIRSRRAKQIDLRQTIADNLRRSDGIDYFTFRRRKPTRLKITLFCDVSKSMDLYARFLIQFMYSFHRLSARVETFVFSTSLTHISHSLKHADFDKTLEELGDQVSHWSGGTDIGRSLDQYRKDYGRKYLDSKTIVLILSDGWDSGKTDVLEENMKYIKKNAAKLIWINPLAGQEGYEPATAGMKAAMPYIDVLTSAHNLESLLNLVHHFKAGKSSQTTNAAPHYT